MQPLTGVHQRAMLDPPSVDTLNQHLRVWHGCSGICSHDAEYHEYLHSIQETPDHGHG